MDHVPLLPAQHREGLYRQPQVLSAPVLSVREGTDGVQQHGREGVDRSELVRDPVDPALVGPELQSRAVRGGEGQEKAGVRALLAPPDVEAESGVMAIRVQPLDFIDEA